MPWGLASHRRRRISMRSAPSVTCLISCGWRSLISCAPICDGRAVGGGSPRHVLGSLLVTIADLVTDTVLDAAYARLCRRWKDWPASADVWRFRQRWPPEKARLREDLMAGTYQVGLLSRVTLRSGEEVDLWSARDAVVMKALALVLAQHLPLAKQCTHVKGHGGPQ